MKTTFTLLLASALALALLTPCVAQDGVASPPAIYLPAGGKVVTEINLSDSDVLGIIKESIPALADVARELLPLKMGASPEAAEAIVNAIDVTGLMEAINGITNVRVVIAKYPSKISPERFVKEFNAGVAKAGQFNRILTDFGFSGGAAGLYALPDNQGTIGFAYDPGQRTAYAARVVGGLDVPKLIKWAGNVAKTIGVQRQSAVEEAPEEAPETPNPAPPATEPAPGN
jgi:hypothetical protein